MSEANITADYEIQAVLRKDSLEMDDGDRRLVRDAVVAAPESCIIVTHGTDTMIETAKVVSDVPGKTIVFTGSIEPAKLKVSDAAFNIGFAVAAVQLLPSGTYVAMNGRLLDPHAAYKDVEAGRFEPRSKSL